MKGKALSAAPNDVCLRRYARMGATAIAAYAFMAAPTLAQDRSESWWVVVGSYPSEPAARQKADLQRVTRVARRCGLQTFNDDSSKFVGFEPGLNVFVVGPFASAGRAGQARMVAQGCFPSAYVKKARYLGE